MSLRVYFIKLTGPIVEETSEYNISVVHVMKVLQDKSHEENEY